MPAAASETAYHHSVRHYHSPFKLEHRNATAFPDPRSPAQKANMEAAQRQLAVLQTYQTDLDRAASFSPRRDAAAAAAADEEPRRTVASGVARRPPVRTAVPGMMPVLQDPVNAHSDHFWGASMSPSRMTYERASTMLAQTVADSGVVSSPIPAHDDGVLSRADSHSAWMEHKYLRFGIHRPRRFPYVSRDEYVDPIRCTSPTQRTRAGWVSRPLPAGHPTGRFGAVREEVAVGHRRAPPHAANLPEKITWHNPNAYQDATEHSTSDESAKLRRLPATVLLTEVEERLRFHGMGSLLDVRLASDEAISALLRDCGFTPTQRMTILWELRKRYPVGGAS